MVVLELGPPHGGFQEGLEGASEVDEAVAHEEEHGEHVPRDALRALGHQHEGRARPELRRVAARGQRDGGVHPHLVWSRHV